MDLDCDEDSFYGNFDRLVAPSDNYSLDDIEEILRSTDSHLDSAIDLNKFTLHNVRDFELPFQEDHNDPFSQPIPRIDELSYSSTKLETERTSSVSSMDEDSFNPDDFINFLRKDESTMDCHIKNELRQRNTPSPTESCSSSGGSSTSGVQSDISSVASRSQTHMEITSYMDPENSSIINAPAVTLPSPASQIKEENCFTPQIKEENCFPPEIKEDNCFTPQIKEDNCFTPLTIVSSSNKQQTIVIPQANTNNVGVSMPVILPVAPVNNSTSATAITAGAMQSLHPLQVQSFSVLPNTLIPVKPLVSLQSLQKANSNIKCPAPIKVEPKLAPKTTINKPNNILKTASSPNQNVSKLVPPTNSKPKTVFLTMNDYKALTQINKNGKGVNAPPKIILKTASGKVITANKIVSSSGDGINSNFGPKIVKTNNGTMVIKHQAIKNIHGSNNTFVSSKSVMSSGPTSLSVYKGLIDEKIWKKQQRMIKNRESASLSRRKKKEYVVSLESRINDLEKENCSLKGENSSLRSQLVALAQSCQCQNSNISEFVLNALDINTKLGGSDQHVRIAPKPSGKSLKQRMSAANVKKNIAILFAMAFMVSMNVGNFQNYMNKNTIENSIELSSVSADEPVATSRRLLWAETETEFKQKLNKTNREPEMDVPPLHFLHPVNRSRATLTSEQNRNITDKDQLTSTNSKCGNGSNYTENYRLHSNLHKWIDVNDYLNLSLYKKHGNDLDNSLRFGKFASDYYDRKPLQLPLQEPVPSTKMKRKIVMTPTIIENKQPKLDMTSENAMGNKDASTNGENSLDIFKPKISDEYLRLFKGIKRQDDTFYVLSFNMDHILLPASAYNKSARPKMSLMLPAGDPSINGDITLMQIDCEVVNTTELELKSFMIPEKLRPQKFGSNNFHPPPNPNDMVNNETREREEHRKDKGTMPEMPKQKSPPQTYYMLGPRSAAAAAAMKKKPIIVRFEDRNEIIENITSPDVEKNNSTIVSKVFNTQ